MDQWYYAKDGQQIGPIGLEAMRGLIENGTIDPAKDLVWNSSMADWLPASQIPVLVGGVTNPSTPSLEPSQPFAYPLATGAIEEIVPGSEPIIPTACLKRAWDLTVKHIGPLLAAIVVIIAISFAISFVFGIIGAIMGIQPSTAGSTAAPGYGTSQEMTGPQVALTIVSNLVSNVVSVFLMLGLTKICLNIVSGKQVSVGMLFGQGDKVLRAFVAGILYALMVVIGLIFLIFPGIYLALRFGQYLNAIVDKDMGIMDAFSYSARITENNKVNLFVIGLLAIGISIAGCIAFIVGLLFAYPMIAVMWVVAYRWMQYGGRAILDDPATGQPLLASTPE